MSSVIVLTSLPATSDNEPIIMDGLYRGPPGNRADTLGTRPREVPVAGLRVSSPLGDVHVRFAP